MKIIRIILSLSLLSLLSNFLNFLLSLISSLLFDLSKIKEGLITEILSFIGCPNYMDQPCKLLGSTFFNYILLIFFRQVNFFNSRVLWARD